MGIFDSFKPRTPVMKVCMMGPRAVGKTTVLTAVFNETQQSIANTTLNLTSKGDTNAVLIDKLHELASAFAARNEINDNADGRTSQANVGGIAASNVESSFYFGFGHIGKEPSIDLVIKDFPGEFVEHNENAVINFIKESQCIFVAIDTPHLMERNGEFNAIKNKPAQITRLFKKALEDIKAEKLVLLLPLKCEKYFHEQRMSEVMQKVQESYSELITFFTKSMKVCCCIEPILTLGGVEFDDFSYNSDESVKISPDDKCPYKVKYKFTGEGKYAPLFCSQPLYSLLLFVAAQYKRDSARTGLLDRLKNMLWKTFNSDESLIEDILKMNSNRIFDNPKLGYKTLCGGSLFNVKDN